MKNGRVSRSGDITPKWRYFRAAWRLKFGAIRHQKSGDFGGRKYVLPGVFNALIVICRRFAAFAAYVQFLPI